MQRHGLWRSGEYFDQALEEGEEDIYRVPDEEGQPQRRKRSLLRDGDVMEEPDDQAADSGDEEAS